MADMEDSVEVLEGVVERFYQKIKQNDRVKKGRKYKKWEARSRRCVSRRMEQGRWWEVFKTHFKKLFQEWRLKGPSAMGKNRPTLRPSVVKFQTNQDKRRFCKLPGSEEKSTVQKIETHNGFSFPSSSSGNEKITECPEGRWFSTWNAIPTEAINQVQKQKKDIFRNLQLQ